MSNMLSAGYVRCSTSMQDGSLEQQKSEIEKYASNNGMSIVRWFEDFDQSGTSFDKRPGFSQLRTCVENKVAGFSLVLVYDESRWGRSGNPRENSYWKLHFERFGVRVLVVNSGSKQGNDIGSCMVEVLESHEASEYSKKLSRSTLRGAKDNASKGFSNGGTPPYGYIRIAVDKASGKNFIRKLSEGVHINAQTEKSKWEIGTPSEVAIVKRIFDERIKGLGIRSIANGLNKNGIPPPKRGRWRNKDQKWSSGTINTILENHTYYGVRVYNKHPQSHISGATKDVWKNKLEDWIILENAHPAIISKAVFQLANRNRKEYSRKNRHFYQSPYLLTGLMKCLRCGFNLQGQNQGKQKRRYYVDGGYMLKGNSVCSHFKVNKEKIEQFIISAIRKRILTSDLPSRVEAELNKKMEQSVGERVSVLAQYERAYADARCKIDRLLSAVESGVEYEAVIGRIKEAQNEKGSIEREIERIKQTNLTPQLIADARKQVEYLMENFESVLKTASLHVQKELLRKFIQRIEVNRETDSIIVYLRTIPILKTEIDSPHESYFIGDNQIRVEKKMPRIKAHKLPLAS